ncbi:phosphonate C-P lyase system protein PhnH [Kiloniella sp. EL199]|uniref:phosphonate C-P lyase system protein PhnH n=1 Tax=Kiloniella sp. EL199 TaxID=2107581 RepID=UPI000EA2B36B|nr:phosphonate C-P lyase system protein PhnH [Kiloniella sp. EL199]
MINSQTNSLSAQDIGQTTLPGFHNPVFDATAVFRTVLDAMSRPGAIIKIPLTCESPNKLNSSAASILLALADMDTTVWLSPETECSDVADYLRFHTGCTLKKNTSHCDFAVINGLEDSDLVMNLPIGSTEYPDRSATLIITVDHFNAEQKAVLSGPGIKTTSNLSPSPLNPKFWGWMKENRNTFPCGVDVIFASPTHICALPRSSEMDI